jgi:hypothetical protein
MGDEVLLSSPNCGYLWWENGFSVTDTNTLINYANKLTIEVAAYAQSCYRSDAATQECSTYIQRSLAANITRNASCPFNPSICVLAQENLVIDTGFINSHIDLGMNAEPKDRFAYRRVTTCAPLKSEGHRENVNISTNSLDIPYTAYFYGENLHLGRNYTYDYPVFRFSRDSKLAVDYTIMYAPSHQRSDYVDYIHINIS